MAMAGGLAGCGQDPAEDVTKAFTGYHAALLARDFATACSYNTPEATAKLVSTLRQQAITVSTCPDALAAIYAEDGGAAQADGVSRSVRIDGITVNGDQATIRWSATLDSEQQPSTSMMRRVQGRWEFVAQ